MIVITALIVSIMIGLVNVLLLYKLAEKQRNGFEDLQNTMSENQKQFTDYIEKSRQDSEVEFKKRMDLYHNEMMKKTGLVIHSIESSQEKTSENLHDHIDQQLKRVNNTLSTYLREAEKEVDEWLQKLDQYTKPEEKIELLESALSKNPSNAELITHYQHLIKPLIAHNDSRVQKSALERSNQVARLYLDNCKPSEYENAKAFYSWVIVKGEEFMSTKYNSKYKQVEGLLTLMETEIKGIRNKDHRKEIGLDKLDQLDRKVDKAFVRKVHQLNKRYQQVSESIVELVQDPVTMIDEDAVADYNRSAVNRIQRIHTAYKSNKNMAHQTLAEGLGGWETQYFYPETNVYYQFVYQSIFNELPPMDKPEVTKKMVNEPRKKVV